MMKKMRRKLAGMMAGKELPQDGDAVFEDANGGVHFMRYDQCEEVQGWTLIGYAFACDGNKCKVLDKAQSAATYLSIWQYSITAISSTSISLKLRMKGDYANYVTVPVTLTSAAINSTTVSEINTALEAAGNTGYVGYANHGYWCYLANDNDEKVSDDADATKIIVQCDICENYQQYNVQGTGCTIALSVWRTMPSSSTLKMVCGASASYAGMNYDKFLSYCETSGTTPTSNVAVVSSTVVNRTSFESSSYCANLRTKYEDYETYIESRMTEYPSTYGVFGLPDGKTLCETYGDTTAEKKDGTSVYVYPALRYGNTAGYGTGKFSVGKWHLSDVSDGMEYMEVDTLAKIAAAQTRMNTTVLKNNVTRWFAQRNASSNAWHFHGNYSTLNGNNVINSHTVQAVTLLEI